MRGVAAHRVTVLSILLTEKEFKRLERMAKEGDRPLTPEQLGRKVLVSHIKRK